MISLPRGGEYELFSTGSYTYCYDDPQRPPVQVKSTGEMFHWIREQDPSLWRSMSAQPHENVALYLKPELYLLWKLRWYQ